MKKTVLGLIAVFAIIGMTGCKTKINEEHGNSFKFSLYSNSSTGYSWDYELSNDGIVDVSYDYDNSGCDPEASGCGGQNIYIVKALKPGKVKLSLTYSFIDPDKYDKETAIYEITVNDDLTISETHYGTIFEED